MATGCAAVRYRQLLYPHGHGYAFWFPEPDENLPADQKATGLRVGDLVILTDDGGWEYLWNIHLAATHPHNFRVPPNFATVPLDDIRDIRKVDNCFDKDTAITTTSVKKSALKIDGGVEPEAAGGLVGGAGGFEFTAEGNSGAILTLPRGGARVNATKLNLYMQEACKNATSWYRHINGTLQRGMLNGALYLVTGTDKCSSWGVASFATSSESHGKKLTFKVSGAANASVSDSNSWTVDFGAEHRAKVVDTNELSQSVFARGYTISLRDKLYLQTGGLGVKVTSPDGSDNRQPFFGSRRPYSRSTDLNRAPSNVKSTHGATTRDAPTESDGSPDADADVRVMRDTQPQKGVAALIGDELLKQNSDAIVAIVHDDDWIASMRSDDFGAADDSQSIIEDLVHHVLTRTDSSAVVVDGVCTLAVPGGVAPSGDTSLDPDPSMRKSGRPQPGAERLGPARRADMPQTMSIHEDARQGTLRKEKLAEYLAGNASILEEKDPAQGLTPLAAAAVAGYADVVDLLLKRGAKADALSRDGETPLLLTARDGARNRARIVQLLLAKTAAGSVDETTARDKNNTPLMYAVLKKDLETVRKLCKAGASLTATNDDGLTAKDMAGGDRNVVRAFNSGQGTLAKLCTVVVFFLQYVVAWVNQTADWVVRHLYGLSTEFVETNVINDETPNNDLLVDIVSENPVLERFFKSNPNYLRELGKKATELQNDKSTVLGSPDLLAKTIKVTLHQQVVYCDDSSSMKRDGRWAAQADLVKRITQITTRILPEGAGVALRFINQPVDDSPNLSLQHIRNIMQNTSWAPNSNTEIGTHLRAKILEPMVYSKLDDKTLERPLLISVFTDGMPSHEADSALVDAIKECGDKLQSAGFPRECVKFMIGQVGTANQATKFLNALRGNQEIADVAFVASDQLDERFAAFRENEEDLDRWLIETLFSAIKGKAGSE